jgi:aryl-alcohol dehydrogenase-like predicted oxidoreductase/lipopolysaccharide/colanic/teichoic acid biosynthesis glycosyltransferase
MIDENILIKKSHGIYNRFVKRMIDFLIALILIIVLSPLILILMLLQLIFSGWPIFYTPLRGGYKNKPFHIIKFRTMVRHAEDLGGGTTALDDKRITKFGKLLRKTKIDEFPQLFNCLSGKMSFIGPRPELLKYVNQYQGLDKYIMEVRPGITDYSSIHFINLDEVVGSGDADKMYEEKVLKVKMQLRLQYVNDISFATDFKIFFKTIGSVIKKMFKALFKNKNDDYVYLANSNLKVSRICFGGCPMGGYGWGKTNEDDFIDAVHCALDNGINFFDTADVYGLGESEIVLGKALQGRRKEAIVASKFGCRRKEGKTYYDNSPMWIREALEESLQRLQTDYIDLYQLHYWDEITPLADIVNTLEELKKEGKIRAYGLSNIHGKQLEELQKYKNKFSSLQNEYSLANRDNEEDFLKIYKMLGITPLTWGSLGQGILAGKIDKNTVFEEGDRRLRPEYINFHGDRFIHNLEIVEVLKKLSLKYKKSVPSVAIRFILDYLPNSIVLVGVKNKKQLLENKEAMGWHLKKIDINRLLKISKWDEKTKSGKNLGEQNESKE